LSVNSVVYITDSILLLQCQNGAFSMCWNCVPDWI